MNGSQTETADEALNKPFALPNYFEALGWAAIFQRAILLFSGIIFLFLLILLKSKTTINYAVEPFLFIYSIFVTSFELSRLASAMFYEKSFAAMLKNSEDDLFANDTFEPKISFVIPCKNEEQDIANTVYKCFQADYPKDKIEIIVINDGSSDNTIRVLRELEQIVPHLKIIDWRQNRGKRQAMAEGFREARGEIVVQLDSDSYLDPQSFRNIITPFQNPEVAAVCAHADPQNADENIVTRMQAAYYFMSFRILKAAESTFMAVFCCSGCSSAYRRSAALPILDGWLNEKFLGLPVTWGDDRALTSRILKSGHKTIYTDQAHAFTIVPNTISKLLRQQLRWKKSWIVNAVITSRFIFKKQPFVAFFYFLPLVLVSFLTPFMTVRALIYAPIIHGVAPFYHIFGILLMTAVIAAYYRLVGRNNKYWPYLFLWSLFNLFVLSLIMFWAVIRIQDRGWGTR